MPEAVRFRSARDSAARRFGRLKLLSAQCLDIDRRDGVTPMLNRLTTWVAAGVLAAAQPVSAAPTTPHEALDLWNDVVTRFVDEQGRTDFEALAADRGALDE